MTCTAREAQEEAYAEMGVDVAPEDRMRWDLLVESVRGKMEARENAAELVRQGLFAAAAAVLRGVPVETPER